MLLNSVAHTSPGKLTRLDEYMRCVGQWLPGVTPVYCAVNMWLTSVHYRKGVSLMNLKGNPEMGAIDQRLYLILKGAIAVYTLRTEIAVLVNGFLASSGYVGPRGAACPE
jgi:hypothetical protein